MPTQPWKRHLGRCLLLAALLAPAATRAETAPVADQIWTLRIASATIGSLGLPFFPPGVPCLPCSGYRPGLLPPLIVDVGESGPVDSKIALTGLFLGVGDVTYHFDLSHDEQLLADYETGVIAYLIIENPPPNLENAHVTLRFTLRQDDSSYWTEQEINLK